jgi:hypothetical protein
MRWLNWLPEFNLRDLIILSVLHRFFGGALNIFSLVEEVNGQSWGPYHLVAVFAFFPSWPLFARLDGGKGEKKGKRDATFLAAFAPPLR